MKNPKILTSLILFLSLAATAALALKGVTATDEDIMRLKRDALAGKIKIGTTRLMDIQNEYGEAPNITDDDQRITYDFGELRLAFERERYWKSWERDSFKSPVYTNDVDDLRFDLESGKLIGDNITLTKIKRTYGEPTSSDETDVDGGVSVYYYGDIKMIFENVISVKSWRGANFGKSSQGNTINTSDIFLSPNPNAPVEPVTSTKKAPTKNETPAPAPETMPMPAK